MSNQKSSPTLQAIDSNGLLTWDKVLPWQRDNEFILTSYRRVSNSYSSSLHSIFQVHNETANIWSHLLGMLVSLVWLYYLHVNISFTFPSLPYLDAFAVEVYYIGVVVCFLLSTFFHTLSDHSQRVHKLGNELDHLGIVLVMWGSGVSSTYFAFYCSHRLRNSYVSAITATAIGCGIFTLQSKFRQPSYRTMRFLMYVFLGSSLFAPCIHGLHLYGWTRLNEMMSLDHFLGLALVNLFGAAIYAARIPERWYPKTFDLLGQSHNLMHVLVLTGAVIRSKGLWNSLGYWELQTSHGSTCIQAGF